MSRKKYGKSICKVDNLGSLGEYYFLFIKLSIIPFATKFMYFYDIYNINVFTVNHIK